MLVREALKWWMARVLVGTASIERRSVCSNGPCCHYCLDVYLGIDIDVSCRALCARVVFAMVVVV